MAVADEDIASLRRLIVSRARAEGFDSVGFASARESPEQARRLREFLSSGHHGEMVWMSERSYQRSAPQNLWQDAVSVISLAMNYAPATDPLAGLQQQNHGSMSAYARGKDYHDLMKKRGRVLGRWGSQSLDTEVKIFVDTAPVMEKPLAQAAGLGWQGKHSNLVSREFGSWLLLAEIFVARELGPQSPEPDHCGSCSQCITICPTAAIIAPYRLDARRCLSYLTIEYKGVIPLEFRRAMGNRIYGCDDCLAVCPWNKFARATPHPEFNPDYRLELLAEFLILDDASFRKRFAGSPIKRIGRDRFIRNVVIAAGNSGDRELLRLVLPLLGDPSPLVRGMAVWAIGQGLTAAEIEPLHQHSLSAETDESVRQEWRSATSPS
ncbi:MAG: tRNA epoxyqueuosine(34) reductase QueG [Alphaproteobacteria bacterium]|nr:tRNA epoxyqueuosine(34) reductase QueG [Alphaproteobacteria bacterium]